MYGADSAMRLAIGTPKRTCRYVEKTAIAGQECVALPRLRSAAERCPRGERNAARWKEEKKKGKKERFTTEFRIGSYTRTDCGAFAQHSSDLHDRHPKSAFDTVI
ncbi:hypothetical protein GWI33_012895 [Rhynchophorus ferrugineus]|uniref:Uncharacterized protein n=1 Tax=Rhynchophorus ferrugineus TaxID=354439 RepID=A0A834I5N5_RHYFE|nr:hypothetical protein GWI33_012895 [Rhynchophorus ferrugineus]